MPGVFRPYTLVDVLGTINDQSSQSQDTSVSGVGFFAEADETMHLADSWTSTVQTVPGWDAGVWGAITWG